jgi:hypothetical protein
MSSLPSTFLRRFPRSTTTFRTCTSATYNRPFVPTFRSNLTPKANFTTTFTTTMPRHETQDQGESTEGISEWKKRAPYKIHDKAEGFDVKYEANCHCGKVKYELSREAPLDSKLCHCTTCQTQHGMFSI